MSVRMTVSLSLSLRLLKVDNNGQEQIAESTAMDNEGYRVDLSSLPNTFSKTTSYTTTQGHTVSTLILSENSQRYG